MTLRKAVIADSTQHKPLPAGDYLRGDQIQLSTDAGNTISLGTDGGLKSTGGGAVTPFNVGGFWQGGYDENDFNRVIAAVNITSEAQSVGASWELVASTVPDVYPITGVDRKTGTAVLTDNVFTDCNMLIGKTEIEVWCDPEQVATSVQVEFKVQNTLTNQVYLTYNKLFQVADMQLIPGIAKIGAITSSEMTSIMELVGASPNYVDGPVAITISGTLNGPGGVDQTNRSFALFVTRTTIQGFNKNFWTAYL